MRTDYGNTKVLDIADFAFSNNRQQDFLLAIRNKLLLYNYSFAWGSKAVKYKNEKTGNLEGIDGDLVVLDTNFRLNGIESIISYDKFIGIPYIKCGNYCNSNGSSTINIDLLKVFVKPLVKYVIFKNRYKSLHLQDVSTALLGYGKLASGKDVMNLSVAERKAYCQHDAHIVADLLKIKNGDILKIMQVIAHHSGLRLDEVCHRGMTSIWNKILNDSISRKISSVGYDNLPSPLRKLYSNHKPLYEGVVSETDEEYDEEDDLGKDEKEQYYDEREDNFEQDPIQHRKTNSSTKQEFRKYKGAIVLEPIRGLHHDVCLFDVTSLYPTMIIKYNLSPETLNCSCCKKDPQARQMFTSEIIKDCMFLPNEGSYWICQNRKGLFAKLLEALTEDRIKYKKAGLEIESQAIKAVINSGYGVFGHPYFKYYDPRLAELVTAFGRDTLTKMQAIANGLGFVTLYGDTDSLFVNNVRKIEDVQKFIGGCKSILCIEVGHEREYLLRVPYTFNSKCVVGGIDPEVKIVQQWDSSKPLPDIDNLLIEFQTFLVDKKLKAEIKEQNSKRIHSCNITTNSVPYIERLLDMGISDYRKNVISLILAPYFVNIQHLSNTEAFGKIKEWVLKCDKVRRLEPSEYYFDYLIGNAIERAKTSGIKPLKFEETLQHKCKALYDRLH